MVNKRIYSIDEIKEIAIPIFQKYGVKRIYLFGSYSNGTATSKSDIDFAIDVNEHIEIDFFDIFNIKEELKKAFKKEIDLFLDADIQYNANRNRVFVESYNESRFNIYG